MRALEERPQRTLMLYLNGDFEGGATEFDVDPALSVRTDVMFRRAE